MSLALVLKVMALTLSKIMLTSLSKANRCINLIAAKSIDLHIERGGRLKMLNLSLLFELEIDSDLGLSSKSNRHRV